MHVANFRTKHERSGGVWTPGHDWVAKRKVKGAKAQDCMGWKKHVTEWEARGNDRRKIERDPAHDCCSESGAGSRCFQPRRLNVNCCGRGEEGRNAKLAAAAKHARTDAPRRRS